MDMIDLWEERFFPKGSGGGEGPLVDLCVQVGHFRGREWVQYGKRQRGIERMG